MQVSSYNSELIDYLAEKLPGIAVEAYHPSFRTRKKNPLPACWVELATISPHPDRRGFNDRALAHVLLTFEARFIADPAAGWIDVQQAALVAWWALHGWVPQTDGVGPVAVKQSMEDVFRPNLNGYLVWMVEFEQEAFLDFADPEVITLLRKLTIEDNFGDKTEIESEES